MGKLTLNGEWRVEHLRLFSPLICSAACIALWFPWIESRGWGDTSSLTAFSAIWCGLPLLASTLVLVAGLTWDILRSSHTTATAHRLLFAAAILSALPAFTVIIIIELVQSFVPRWLTPVLTNSELLTLRAGSGAWLHLGLVIAASAMWWSTRGLARSNERHTSAWVAWRVVLILTVVVLAVLRSAPLFNLEVAPAANQAEGFAAIGLVSGEVPFLGLISTTTFLLFAVGASWLAIRPNPWVAVAAATGLGSQLFVIWLQVVGLRLVSGVVPDRWKSLVGDRDLISVTTSPVGVLTYAVAAVAYGAILAIPWSRPESRDTPSFPTNNLTMSDSLSAWGVEE